MLSILYVDDDDDIRHIVGLSLALDRDIAVKVAASGDEALALVDAGWTPDVAVLDVMMPGMDGGTLLKRLRERPSTRNTPVIFMTARGRPADVADYRARGALGVILKPFDPVAIAGEIRALIEDSAPKAQHK